MPTTPRSNVFETQRIGIEALGASGTPVLATKQVGAMAYTITPLPKTDAFKPAGSKLATAGTLINEQTTIKGDGRPDFREIIYPLSATLTDPVITTPASAITAKQFQWLMNVTSPDAQRSFTLESGSDSVRAAHIAGVQLTDFTLTTTKTDVPKLSVAGFGNAWSDDHVRWLKLTGATAGTFTISITLAGGSIVTSGAIAYNAAASVIDTAIEAMSNIGAGNARVTGGPANTTAVRIELIGTKADAVITAWTVSGASLTGTTPTAVLTRLSPGTTAIDNNAISPTQMDQFVSTTSFANLDTVMALSANSGAETDVTAYTWGITGRNAPYYTMNTNTGYSPTGIVEQVPKTTISFDVMSGDRSGAFNAYLRGQTLFWHRWRAKGAFIETASTVDYYYQLLIDTCMRITGISEIKAITGTVLGHTFTGEWFKDPTTSRGAIVTLITDQTAL